MSISRRWCQTTMATWHDAIAYHTGTKNNQLNLQLFHLNNFNESLHCCALSALLALCPHDLPVYLPWPAFRVGLRCFCRLCIYICVCHVCVFVVFVPYAPVACFGDTLHTTFHANHVKCTRASRRQLHTLRHSVHIRPHMRRARALIRRRLGTAHRYVSIHPPNANQPVDASGAVCVLWSWAHFAHTNVAGSEKEEEAAAAAGGEGETTGLEGPPF